MHEARTHGFHATEQLGMNAGFRESLRKESGTSLVHEYRRAAKVDVCIEWNAKALERVDGNPPMKVIVAALGVRGIRAAECDQSCRGREAAQQVVYLGGEGVFLAVPASVNPVDMLRGRRRMAGEFVEHRQDGSDSDTGAPEHHGMLVLIEEEIAARC